MDLKIIYDNRAEKGFLASWGFSCLIEAEENILFDVGWDPHILLHNMQQFNMNLADIQKIVLSHAHWDHTGALPSLLSKDVTVYIPQSFSQNLKREISDRAALVEVSGKMKVSENVSTTGELGDTIKEQSLILTPSKSFIVTGCAHPGLDTIIKAAAVPNYGIIGGFHSFSQLDILKDAFMVCPCHCTQHTEDIEKLYRDKVRTCRAGCILHLGD